MYSFHILRQEKKLQMSLEAFLIFLSRLVSNNIKKMFSCLTTDCGQGSWWPLGPAARGVINIAGGTGGWSHLHLRTGVGTSREWGAFGKVLQPSLQRSRYCRGVFENIHTR